MGEDLLYKELSYKIQGILMVVRKTYGPGLKEIVYCNAIEEYLIENKIKYKRECNVDIVSPLTGKIIGNYRLDFLINDQIILEIKSVDKISRNFVDQIYSYLKTSKYELGIFVNFKSPNLYIKRVIYTNDRKKQFVKFV